MSTKALTIYALVHVLLGGYEMGKVETAERLSFIGGILASVLGTIYLILIVHRIWRWGMSGTRAILVYAVLCLIFGSLTLFVARPYIKKGGDLIIGAIMCFIFGGISAGAIGGILTIVAGVLAILASSEQRKAVVAEAPPPPPPPTGVTPTCSTCGQPLTFIQQYGRWYCYNCKKYP